MVKIKYLLTVLGCGLMALPVLGFDTTSSSCEIDLLEQTHTCDNYKNLDIDFDRDSALLTVDLAPSHEYQRVRFAVHYDSAPEGWTVNIGDSATNNGFGGDSITQSNDAELQILDSAFTIYGNDYTPEAYTTDNLRQLLSDPQFITESRDVTLEIGDGYVYWDNGEGKQGTLELPYLFALDNQEDREGLSNYTFYAGFNQVVSGSRTGSGVTQVTVTFLRAGDTTDTGDEDSCDILPSRLAVGQSALVSADMTSIVYAGPTRAAKQLDQLPGGTSISVVAGPICQGTERWWFVNGEAVSGWTAESTGYWLEPLSANTRSEN